jgi:hypothetical protein
MGNYSDRIINGRMHKWLQYIGWVPCVPVIEIKVGDSLMFNSGYTNQVTNIVKETKKTITFELDHKYQKRMSKTTHWPIVPR